MNKKNLKIVLLIAVIGSMIVAARWYGDQRPVTVLSRPQPGESAKEYELTVQRGKEEWEHKGTIAARIYSSREIDEEIQKAKEYIMENLFYEGESADNVITGIRVTDKIKDSIVKAEYFWDTDLLDGKGSISEKCRQKETVIISVRLRCQDYMEWYEFPIRLCPMTSARDDFQRSLDSELQRISEEADEASEIVLPTEWKGEAISFSEKRINLFLIPPVITAAALIFKKAYEREKETEKRKKRETELEESYSDFVGRFEILMGAGMNPYGVFSRLDEEYAVRRRKGGSLESLYEEIRILVGELNNGVNEKRAYEEFGIRTGKLCYIRFASILTQNLKMGSRKMLDRLEYESIRALEDKRDLLKKRGEELETKILFPMMLQLGLVLLIVMIPAFMAL